MMILGKKVKMTQLWKDKAVIPVTVVQALPNTVSFIRTKERDGYEATQLSVGRVRREARGMIGKALGDVVTVADFAAGDRVRVVGTSKGRGFQGGVKRHGFHGGPKTHGQKNRLRAPGSIGSTAPQRVLPGRKMAGHMGVVRVTTSGLTIVQVDAEKNLLYIKGAVPGAPGGLVEIRK
jgi:large subunit ribosomal protein L3